MSSPTISPPPLRSPLQLPAFSPSGGPQGAFSPGGSQQSPTAALTSSNLSPAWIGFFTQVWQSLTAATAAITSPSTVPTTPNGSTPVPPVVNPSPPTVSALPANGDAVQQVLFNGVLYQWVGSSQFAGITGFWEPVVPSPPALQDTHANRLAHFPAGSYPTGTLFFETDRTVIYIVQAGAWVWWSGAMADVLANQPTDLGADDVGFPFQATDYKHLFRWGGAAFAFDSNDPGSGWLVVDHPGFFLTNGLYGLCDGSTYAVAQTDATTMPVTPAVAANTYIRR